MVHLVSTLKNFLVPKSAILKPGYAWEFTVGGLETKFAGPNSGALRSTWPWGRVWVALVLKTPRWVQPKARIHPSPGIIVLTAPSARTPPPQETSPPRGLGYVLLPPSEFSLYPSIVSLITLHYICLDVLLYLAVSSIKIRTCHFHLQNVHLLAWHLTQGRCSINACWIH